MNPKIRWICIATAVLMLLPLGAQAQTPGAGRVLDCTPETQSSYDSATVTCVVTDASGTPTPGVDVTFTSEGVGTISSAGTTPEPDNDAPDGHEYRTDANGQVVITVERTTSGLQTVTGTISGQAEGYPSATDECARAADDPPGSPQGVCQDAVTIDWPFGHVDVRYPTNLSIRYRPRLRLWQGVVNSTHAGCVADRPVRLKRVEPGQNPVVGEGISDERGRWRITRGNRAGRYYAVVRNRIYTDADGEFIYCYGDRSETVRID